MLELIIGPMFAGKTTRLLERVSRYKSVGKKVMFVNSVKDVRCDEEVRSHSGLKQEATKVSKLASVDISLADVIGIDEVNFFDDVDVIRRWQNEHPEKVIIVAGLRGDYLKRPFGKVLELIPMANDVEILDAFCMICKDGTNAPFTKRIVECDDLELVGGEESYIAVCEKHYHSS